VNAVSHRVHTFLRPLAAPDPPAAAAPLRLAIPSEAAADSVRFLAARPLLPLRPGLALLLLLPPPLSSSDPSSPLEEVSSSSSEELLLLPPPSSSDPPSLLGEVSSSFSKELLLLLLLLLVLFPLLLRSLEPSVEARRRFFLPMPGQILPSAELSSPSTAALAA